MESGFKLPFRKVCRAIAGIAFTNNLLLGQTLQHPKHVGYLPQENKYKSRLNLRLKNHGRHVPGIAMLYSIATLQAGHRIQYGMITCRKGVEIPEARYVKYVRFCLLKYVATSPIFTLMI